MSAWTTRPLGLGKLRRGQIRPSRVMIAYWCLGVALVGYLILGIVRPTGDTSTLIDGWGVDAFELIASVLCIVAGLQRRSDRAVPVILGAALLSWSLGDLVLTIESLGGVVAPIPSLADAFYLCFFPLAYVALVLVVRGEARRLTAANWLDGAAAGLGAGALCAAFAFNAVRHFTGDGALTVGVNLAYPVGDVLLLLLVMGGAAIMAGTNKLPWLLVAVGITVNVFGDTSNLLHTSVGSSLVGTVANDTAWPISILLMSAAMWLPRGTTDPLALPRPPSFMLPGIAAGLGLGILFLASLDPINHVATALAAATLAMVVGRTGLSVHTLRALTRERQRLAVTDHLTGLGNRRRLFEVLDGFFAEPPEQGGRRLAFLFIDLDGFKQINDSFGHPAGDEVLKHVSDRLARSLRESDLLTRVGGDEFGAILIDAGAPEAAEAARRLAASLNEPFTIDSVSAQIGASIGIALAPADAADSAEVVWCSDVAMYRAKLASSAFAFYEQDFDEAGNRLALADDLRVAIESRQLVLHYQPQLDLRTGEITTLEALVRWQHPSLGLVAPLKFLPLAEEAGLMEALTQWVLAHALRQCAAWRREGRALTVSVNMSAGDLLGAGFVDLVTELLSRHELPASALVLEITETTIIREFERSRAVVWSLRELGVLVSIDDFGAGFTSLAYLSGLAVGELKLDRAFITPVAGDNDARAMELLRATIELGHALGLRVVAEGVEDAATLGLLRRLGCDVAQGYCIGKAVPPHKLTCLSSRGPVPAASPNGSRPPSRETPWDRPPAVPGISAT